MFIEDGGYDARALWDAQGWEWRQGTGAPFFDYTANTPPRLPEARMQPSQWAFQEYSGNRPVTGINWFEARAYARWLDRKLREQIEHIPELRRHHVRLSLQ